MLRPISPLVNYALNQDYIAEFLCINKDKPELQCNGKCHLVKELEKSQKEEQNKLRINLEEYPISTLHHPVNKLVEKPLNFREIRLNSRYENRYNYLFSFSIFHPPSV